MLTRLMFSLQPGEDKWTEIAALTSWIKSKSTKSKL